jgi:hypothetical protein
MIHKDFTPLQEKVEMYMKVDFKHQFGVFANAFLKKYNCPNSWVLITICKVSHLDDNRFAFIRRYDSVISSVPYYERIVYDRENKLIEASMMEEGDAKSYPKIAEQCVYKAEGDSTIYETFLYKNPGWNSFMRRKMHAWGVDRMNTLLANEFELMKQKKEIMKQKKDEFIEYAKKTYTKSKKEN